MAFTGAVVRIGTTGGLGQGEARLQGVTGLDGELFAIGRTHNRIIHVTDLATPSGVFVSAALGAPHSIAGHNGSLYAFIGRQLKRFDPPFSDTDTGTDVFEVPSGRIPRALTSDSTSLFYMNQLASNNLLYRIDDIDGTPTETGMGTISGTSNIRGMVWFDGRFWGVDPSTDALYYLTITNTGITRTQVGSFSQFGIGLGNPQGLGVVNGVGYVVSIDNSGSLYRLRDFKFTEDIADQSWTVGEAVSLSAPSTENGASPITFAISPELPAGVTLDTSDGSIDGTPTARSDETEYALTATDDNGIKTTTTFQATVGGGTQPPPPVLVPTTLEIVSGNNQDADVSTQLSDALVVRVLDQNGDPFSGAEVTFSASPSGGRFSDETVTTGANGEASTLFTLGSTAGDYTITASVTGLTAVIFTATANEVLVATTLVRISGNNQSAEVGNALSDDLVVEVRDQNGDAFADAVVTFVVSPNDGTLSETSVTTGNNGRASTALTLGTTAGIYTVTASVRGLDDVSFTATATAPPPPPPPTDAVLEITVSPNSVTAGGIATVTFSFDKAVGDFTDVDVDVSQGAAKGTLTRVGNTNVWTMPVTAPRSGSGTVTVSVDADVVSPGNNADSVQFDYTAPPKPPPRVRSVPRFTNAPMDVKVELTPTTALITWKAPTNGASIREYEISYEEGASPGTTRIPTGSRSTRFLVKGLKRGTQYTWQVRGVTENGAGDASRPITMRTPIASLHNALFFKECVNYFGNGERVSEYGNPSNIIRAAGDNDYRTFTREKDLVLDISVNGAPTRVDAVCVKGIGIEGHSAEPIGGTGVGYSNRMMPETVKNWEGTDVSMVVHGFQHDLFLLEQHFTATSVRMTFTGTDAIITEILLLEFGLEIDANSDFTEIATNFVDRTGVIHPDAGSGIQHTPTLGSERDKWQVDYVVKIVPGKTILETPEEFLYWRAENRNHIFCMEPSRFPWRIFPAVFVGKSVPVRYRTDDKLAGEVLNFRVAEQ